MSGKPLAGGREVALGGSRAAGSTDPGLVVAPPDPEPGTGATCARRFLGGSNKLVLLAVSSQYLCITASATALGALFDVYIQTRKHGSNKAVGFVELLRGLATLAFALPTGYAVDRWTKTSVLKGSVLVGIAGLAVLFLGQPFDFTFFVVLGAVVMSIQNQAFQDITPAVIADSTTTFERTDAIDKIQTSMNLGNASGPFLQMVLLLMAGDSHWELSGLHRALALSILPFVLYAGSVFLLTREHERVMSDGTASRRAGLTADQQAAATPCWKWGLAALIEVQSFITAIGSGMTFKFWPLFFKHDYQANMLQVCLLMMGMYGAIALSTIFLNPLLLKYMDNLMASTVLHLVGTFLLFMISLPCKWVLLVAPLVVLRNALMNSIGPLQQAQVSSLVPEAQRGKWSCLFVMRRMTWSASAMVGGALSDYSYRHAFFAAACMHTLAGIVLIAGNLLRKAKEARQALAH